MAADLYIAAKLLCTCMTASCLGHLRTTGTKRDIAVTTIGLPVDCIPLLLGSMDVEEILAMHAGDLGAIDTKYDVPVSTAAPALDYIVVDDTPTAQRCVELLRARKLGVATFLILDKQAHLAQKASEKASPPEGDVIMHRQIACILSRSNFCSAGACLKIHVNEDHITTPSSQSKDTCPERSLKK